MANIRKQNNPEDKNVKISHTHHIAVNTVEIERSVSFYRDILGFQEVKRADMGPCTLVYMKISEDAYMELFDLRGNTECWVVAENCRGLRHIAFEVDDISAWNVFLKEKGIPFVQEISEMPEIGKRALLISDPNGVVVELCESIS
ncbi:VOC family protein [Christensenella massiliensis]|uniref:VOC family protein n=1 Tax=Christensenella massiliensis TaxID=1805714 RepID=A0AAU8A9D9_9FIRM